MDIVMIVDRSGSMSPLRKDVVGGFNTFLAEQQAQPGAENDTLTLIAFADTIGIPIDCQPLKAVTPLAEEDYITTGMTALVDAVGTAITMTTARKPDKAIFAIFTDGEENASREWTLPKLKKMVEDVQKDFGWKFVFAGANIDAFAEAGAIGVPMASAVQAQPGAVGVRQSMAAYSNASTEYRKIL